MSIVIAIVRSRGGSKERRDSVPVAPHIRRRLDDRRAYPIAVGVVRHLDVAAVQNDLAALLLSGCYKAGDAIFGGG